MQAIYKKFPLLLLFGVVISFPFLSCKSQFIKHIITGDFISEGVAIADINKDGKDDIIAGAYWFEAPNWTKHAIANDGPFFFATGYSNSFLDYCADVNQDGWIDVIRVGLPGEDVAWYENPHKKQGLWKMHAMLSNFGNESPAFVDVDGDGRPDLLGNDPINKQVIWLKQPVKKGDTSWTKHVIASGDLGTHRYTHGLGFADMNADGRPDVTITKGWWEAPSDRTQANWVFHPADFGQDCAQMFVLDLDGDGDLDVISSSAHDYGIWWHEQVIDAAGNISWKEHEIDKSVSETHALALADINGDGQPDLVTGKRYFAHFDKDPGALEPSVLAWFEFKPGKNPQWVKHEIDNNSGVGLQVLVQDINADGLPDIIIGNKKGVFFFEHTK